MIICVCHRVSDRHIDAEVRSGCASFDELQDFTRVGTGCGVCRGCAVETFHSLRQVHLALQAGPVSAAPAAVHGHVASPALAAATLAQGA